MSQRKAITPSRWLLLFLLGALTLVFWFIPRDSEAPTPPSKPTILQISDLIPEVTWSELDRFQSTITRETFLRRLTQIYTKSDAWQDHLTVLPDHAMIGTYRLDFAPGTIASPGAIWDWQGRHHLPPSRALPLAGLHIAIDPGHIGGAFSQLEERHLKYGDHAPIREGSMTLATARLLRPLLEAQGAQVSLVRDSENPVTDYRPINFQNPILFYRTSEIRARARKINHTLQPDLVLCLHYNATGSPVPLPGQHLHLILNGTYTRSELANEDERFTMLQRLLSGVIEEEIPLSAAIAESFARRADLPPYTYPANSPTSQNIAGNPYLWARNLLANRLYLCPVIFLEPYVMNSTEFISAFKESPETIYQEYAQAVLEGLLTYYSQTP